jgi:hypothetical protein
VQSLLKAILVVLLFSNTTLVMNGWLVGRVCLWLALLISGYFLVNKFGLKVLALLGSVVFFKAVQIMFPAAESLYNFSLGITFGLAGLVCFGESPDKLRKIFVLYLLINLPILVVQITGGSSVVMYWNTDYLHDVLLMSIDEVGTFKDMALYPTFLVGESDLFYQIGQGRPSGLMSSNNLLSVVVLFAVLFNLHLRNRATLNMGDLVTNMAAVLVMSKLVFVSMLFIYLFGIFSNTRVVRVAALKNVGLWLVFLLAYYLCFPGLFSINLGLGMLTGSIGVRVIDIFLAAGIGDTLSLFWFASAEYGLDLTREVSSANSNTSGLANVLESDFRVVMIILACLAAFKFRNAVLTKEVLGRSQVHFYYMFLIIIGLTFLVIPMLFQSILFMFIMGLIFQPLVGHPSKRLFSV